MEEYSKDFSNMTDSEKLISMAAKTQELFKKAKEFDNKMNQLHKTYNFLEYGINKEEKLLKADAKNNNNNGGVVNPFAK
jgi:hypothetical protein